MPLSLIGKIKANNTKDEHGQYPYTDADAQIVLDARDGENPESFTVESVNPIHVSDGKVITEFNGSFNISRKLTWTITITDCRILYWAPELIGAFGGIKSGCGNAATVGHMRYDQLATISVNNDSSYSANPHGYPDIMFEAHHYVSPTTKAYIESDVKTLKAVLTEFSKRYNAFMQGSSVWKSESESNLKKIVGFDWENGKGIALLDLDVSPARLETAGNPQFEF